MPSLAGMRLTISDLMLSISTPLSSSLPPSFSICVCRCLLICNAFVFKACPAIHMQMPIGMGVGVGEGEGVVIKCQAYCRITE